MEAMTKRATLPVEWKVSKLLTDYREAARDLLLRAQQLACNDSERAELVWLLEHPPLVSLGRSSKPSDILPANRLPVVHTSRGGQTTCHAPGQCIVYFALDLRKRDLHIRAFVEQVGAWVCKALATWGIEAQADREAIGVWVGSKKIAAMGFRVSRGIATHGVAINRAVDLSLYRGIVACGLGSGGLGSEDVVTSMEREGVEVSREELEQRLEETCPFFSYESGRRGSNPRP